MATAITTRFDRQRSLPDPKYIRGMKVGPWAVKFLADIPGTLTRLADQKGYDSVIGFTPGKRKFIVAFGPKNNRQVLGDKERFRTTGYMFNGPRNSAISRIRDGLIHSRGERHTKVRKLLQPIFAGKSLRSHFEQFIAVTDECTRNWKVGQQINLWEEMCLLARRFSGRILIGRESDERLDHLSHMIETINRFTFKKMTWAVPYDIPGTNYRKMLQAAESVESDLLKMIQRRRRGNATDGQYDILSTMVNARFDDGEALTDSHLVGQIFFFYAASFETVASVLTWTNSLIAQHPEIARDLLDEIDAVCGGGVPTLEQVGELNLLDRVLKESTRVLPPIPGLARQTTCDCEISGMSLSKNDRVLVSPFVTHRNPDVWENALRFDPSRWEQRKPTSWEWLPFSAGARHCVATNYSMVLKVTLSIILQRFRLEIAPKSKIDRSTIVIMRPKPGVMMNVRSTEDRFSATSVTGKLAEMVDINAEVDSTKRFLFSKFLRAA